MIINNKKLKDHIIEYANNNNYEINYVYLERYNNFIKLFYENKFCGRGENHHIIPVCINKDLLKEQTNIIHLSCRAHFLCHLMLTRIFKNRMNKLLFAFNTMNNINNPNRGSRIYEDEKLAYRSVASVSRGPLSAEKLENLRQKVKVRFYKIHNNLDSQLVQIENERNRKHSETLKSKSQEYWNNIRIKYMCTYNQNSPERIAEINRKKGEGAKSQWLNLTEDEFNYRKNIRKYNAKKWWETATDEEKLNRNKRNSEGQHNLSIIKCPYCGKEMRSRGNMNKYHNENCLMNPNLSPEELQTQLDKRAEWNKKNSEGQRKKRSV